MRWFLYAPLQLLIMIICYITNPVIVMFADKDGELHSFLRRWQTFDDSCDSAGISDMGLQSKLKRAGNRPLFYLHQIYYNKKKKKVI